MLSANHSSNGASTIILLAILIIFADASPQGASIGAGGSVGANAIYGFGGRAGGRAGAGTGYSYVAGAGVEGGAGAGVRGGAGAGVRGGAGAGGYAG
ncbi:hypothetical protein NPIL_314171 [Nephila pilipes]|uniref:Uncharacterized protein n=1 Tax=Nephila pilipes TaxID=299642 RepID=A0A8X6MQL3_NEPPI|nr:hypothetical protein NPIL_314171 [Nephila pilipes]